MPYCPECGDEFQDWVKICPDCHVALVDELPDIPEVEMRGGRLVHVATAPNEIEARIWEGILEENGIHCMIKVTEGLNIYVSPLALEHKIYVLESDADEAGEILGSLTDEPVDE